MAHQDPSKIRNVAVLGHRGTGKTSLVEALLFTAGATKRMGNVADGTTVSDFDDEEQRRGMSISASLCHLEWRGTEINLIDAPGESSFLADSLTAIRASDCALMIVNAQNGVEVSTERLWERCEEAGLARAVVVNMLDRERADFDQALEALREMSPGCVAVEIPMGSEAGFNGIIDLVSMHSHVYSGGPKGEVGEIPAEYAEAAQAARERLIDIVAEADDELIEKYLSGEEITTAELLAGIHKGILERRIFPVVCAAGGKDGLGADQLLDLVVDELPAPPELGAWTGIDTTTGEETPIELHEDGPAVAYCFKTLADQFSGNINVFRVFQGALTCDTQVIDTAHRRQGAHRPAAQAAGQRSSPSTELGPGDIGAVAKLKDVVTGDTLCADGDARQLPGHRLPGAAHELRRHAEEQGRRGQGHARPCAASPKKTPCSRSTATTQTGEMIVGGMSQVHVEVTCRAHEAPLRRRGRSQAAARAVPRDHQGHRQGRGQAQEADRRPRPVRRHLDGGRARCRAATGFEFVDKIVGGAIPRNFIPAVEKGVVEAMDRRAPRRLPGRRRAGDPLRRQVPPRRLVATWRSRSPARWASSGRRSRRRSRCFSSRS